MTDARKHSLKTLFLGTGLLVFGILIGYGFQARGAKPQTALPKPTPVPTQAPVVKGLRASPDGKVLAFTAVYDVGDRASVFLLDPKSGKWSARESPLGWQDYVTQWRSDGSELLLEREKIPRRVAEAKSGLYSAPIEKGELPKTGELKPLTQGLAPENSKIITGFWTPDGILTLKTRREPKSLFLARNGATNLVDSSNVTYHQNRAVRENGKLVFYVVRDVPNQPQKTALFRVENGRARQLGASWSDFVWAYVSESARQMIVARQNPNGEDWDWTLYQISPRGAKKGKTAKVPGDVITVYWSPDEKRVLGAAGASLWVVEIPSLQTRRLGQRDDWNADDASWIGRQNAVAVGAGGQIWRVEVPSGTAKSVWKFPAKYWK